MSRPAPTSAPVPVKRPRRWVLLAGLGAVALLGALLPLLTPSAPPASIPNAPGQQPATPPDLTPMLTRLIAGTVTVLVLGVSVLVVLSRWLKPVPGPQGKGHLRVVGAVRLDPRSLVYVVQARGQRLLAGVDGTGLKAVVPLRGTVSVEAEEPPESRA